MDIGIPEGKGPFKRAESRDIAWLQGYHIANETHGDISPVDMTSSPRTET